ncbi:MAG: shikimate kinase [Clostridia bacterium]|nr:shikimate kinase [Clostridia bacterium]
MENIALIGFMGTGKTSVGIILAQRLGWSFVDTDEIITRQTGMDIPDIFKYYGENYFRQREKEAIEMVCRLRKHVIATGGGVILNSDNIKKLKENSYLICLSASPEEILERVKYDKSRPLLEVEDPLKIIKNLLKIREPYYQCADLFVDTSKKTLKKIIEEILDQIKQRGIVECRL